MANQGPLLDFEPGIMLKGRYLTKEKLGKGGYGKVYEVIDQTNYEPKAAKCVDNKTPQTQAELKACKSLRGVNGIPPLLDTFVFEGRRVFVTPMYAGDLDKIRSHNKGQSLAKLTCMKICYDLVTVAENIHKRGYLHRDIKPANVVLLPLDVKTGRIVLIDLGCAVKFRDCGFRLNVPCDYQFALGDNSTWRMAINKPAAESEDCKMIGFTIMMLRNLKPFGTNPDLWTLQKKYLEEKPDLVLKGGQKWLRPIMKVLFGQIYMETPDYDAIRAVLDSEGGWFFDHDAPLKTIRPKDNSYIRLK